MSAALKFKTSSLARQPGELARLRVVEGPDYGAVFVITASPASVGRGEDNDIMISDLKSSRKHAEFSKGPQGWGVKDLASANGIIFNGKPSRGSALKSTDTITLGETTLEFLDSDVATGVLENPSKELPQIKEEQKALEVQRNRIRSLGELPGRKPKARPAAARPSFQLNKKKAPPLLIIGVLGLGYFLFLDDPKPAPKKKGPIAEAARTIASYLPGNGAPDPGEKSADRFFKEGFREYRSKNYIRAKSQFETALQIVPNHALAQRFLDYCEQEIKSEVSFHLQSGKKDFEAGKTKEAKIHFESVMRLLYQKQADPAYVEARDQLEKLTQDDTSHQDNVGGGT